MYATDEDKLRSKYMDSISSQMSELYKEKREVQADTSISNKYKYIKVQKIQEEINNLAKEGLSNYESFSKTDTYSQIGDTEYYKNNEGKWTKVNESDAEFTAGLTDTEKQSYYVVKNKVSELESEYKTKSKNRKNFDEILMIIIDSYESFKNTIINNDKNFLDYFNNSLFPEQQPFFLFINKNPKDFEFTKSEEIGLDDTYKDFNKNCIDFISNIKEEYNVEIHYKFEYDNDSYIKSFLQKKKR
jgi:hypothetical protein